MDNHRKITYLLYLLSHSHLFIHKFINVTSELLYVLVG